MVVNGHVDMRAVAQQERLTAADKPDDYQYKNASIVLLTYCLPGDQSAEAP
jgi:predicted protein tyrosine phosphatase